MKRRIGLIYPFTDPTCCYDVVWEQSILIRRQALLEKEERVFTRLKDNYKNLQRAVKELRDEGLDNNPTATTALITELQSEIHAFSKDLAKMRRNLLRGRQRLHTFYNRESDHFPQAYNDHNLE